MTQRRNTTRALHLILGDQLSQSSPLLERLDRTLDRIVMIEAREESRRVVSHQSRSTLFLAAMRHHAEWLRTQGYPLDYLHLDHPDAESFTTGLKALIGRHRPQRLVMSQAGEFGVAQQIAEVCKASQVPLVVLPDPHFLCSDTDFQDWRANRRSLVMEHFYRWMRKRHRLLMQDDQPEGGKWNFDHENRKTFGRQGPGLLVQPLSFTADAITRQVRADVARHFGNNPGQNASFDWPVTRTDALRSLRDFLENRLPAFGSYQDAMWTAEPYLYHSTLSAALNLKLLDPREVLDAAIQCFRERQAPLNAVEGFVRQIIGWREFVRGVYWSEMPTYLERNSLQAEQPLPGFYWTADTDMHCLHQVIRQTLDTGYAHHIQRLMVTGLFALLLGVRPAEVHAWYLAVYVDAVEWVEAPNTLGMSQFADGGLLASKPYIASGRYIQRMSNYCEHCRYRPDRATGTDACPFTTLYWDFMLRHRKRFAHHPRAALQWRSLDRLDAAQRRQVQQQANVIINRLAA